MPTYKESDFLTKIFFNMKNKKEMLELFQVEELEKRYEMGWIRVVVGAPGEGTGTDLSDGSVAPIGEGTPEN
jgi:hypothetical protein